MGEKGRRNVRDKPTNKKQLFIYFDTKTKIKRTTTTN